MASEILRWNMPHSFEIEEGEHGLTGTLTIQKKGGTQKIPVVFPRSMTLSHVRDAWRAQGGRWLDEFVHDGNPFIAVRSIRLFGWRILWFVYHENERPNDGCSIVPMPLAPSDATEPQA